mgnify:CR=1 FL=1
MDNILKIINDISKLFRNNIRTESDKMGMIGSFWPILMHLSSKDGLTQLELVQLTLMTPPSTSLKLQKMEQDGLINRYPDNEDLRQVRVFLTEKGKKLSEEMRIIVKNIEAQAIQNISKEELEKLSIILLKIKENLQEINR